MKPTKELLIMISEIEQNDCPLTRWQDFVCQPGRVFLHFPALGIREFCCLINFHRTTHSHAVKQQLSRARYTPLKVLCDVWSLRATAYLSLLLPIHKLTDIFDASYQYCTEYYQWRACLIYTTFQDFVSSPQLK